MEENAPVVAAGAVVWREADHGLEVLLVHRPRYDDWSFPKGKLDPDEHLLAAAVREVGEETGLSVRLGPPLPRQEYTATGGETKHVFYWSARPVGDSGVADYEPNREIDAVTWVPLEQARDRLTYARDIELLDVFTKSPYRSEPLVVLRHAKAMSRSGWPGPDQQRGLAAAGETQARDLVPLLQAYGVGRVLTSDAVRCTATVGPYVAKAGLSMEVDAGLSEQGSEESTPAARISALMDGAGAVVVCSHRPVLPLLFDALGVQDPALRPAAFVVAHRADGRVLATEQHLP